MTQSQLPTTSVKPILLLFALAVKAVVTESIYMKS